MRVIVSGMSEQSTAYWFSKPSQQPLKLGVLVSGGGRTLINILDHINAGKLHAEVVTVIASNEKSQQALIDKGVRQPIHTISRKAYDSTAAFSQVIFQTCRDAGVELVCLAGFLSLVEIPSDYEWRVLNIHPALLPAFGGRGMYGHHVHEAVLAHGCKVSGCTIHFADQTYDTGPILTQRTCDVLHDDDPDTLAARVFEQECIAYPQAIEKLAQGCVTVQGRVTLVR